MNCDGHQNLLPKGIRSPEAAQRFLNNVHFEGLLSMVPRKRGRVLLLMSQRGSQIKGADLSSTKQTSSTPVNPLEHVANYRVVRSIQCHRKFNDCLRWDCGCMSFAGKSKRSTGEIVVQTRKFVRWLSRVGRSARTFSIPVPMSKKYSIQRSDEILVSPTVD